MFLLILVQSKGKKCRKKKLKVNISQFNTFVIYYV